MKNRYFGLFSTRLKTVGIHPPTNEILIAPMDLHPVIQELYDLLSQKPPEGASLSEMRSFRMACSKAAELKAELLPQILRAELISHIQGYIRETLPPAEKLRTLFDCQSTLETAIETAMDETRTSGGKQRTLPFEIFEGYGASPTALVRTEFFANQQSGTQIFKLLGMNLMNVERGNLPLNDTHFVLIVFLVSLVRNWDEELGVNLRFNPWDAVRRMGWSVNNLSLQRLKDAIDRLADTTVRVYHDHETDREEAAPMIARRVTEMDKAKRITWEVQLTSTLLEVVSAHRTYIKFETLAALPGGCATLLYAFIASEKSKQTEWDVEDLARLVGLNSSNPDQIKRKLKAALEILVCGLVEVKPRGEAVREVEGLGEVDFNSNGELVVRSKTSKTKTFSPPLESFSFHKTQKGKVRVRLIKRNA